MLGMTAQRLRPALHHLKLLGHVQVITGGARGGRGRPRSSFQLSPDIRLQLRRIHMPKTAHLEEIEKLCQCAFVRSEVREEQPGNLMRGDQRRNLLTPANRCLLSVLLLHAETPGVVTGLSYSSLVMLTGMGRECLKSQIRKLKDLGVIAHHEPGVMRERNDMRMRSVYFINVAHPALLGRGSVGLTVLAPSPRADNTFNYLSGFYEAALVISDLSENESNILKRIEAVGSLKKAGSSIDEQKNALDLRAKYSRAYASQRSNALALLPSNGQIKPIVEAFIHLRELQLDAVITAHVFSYVAALLNDHWKALRKYPLPTVIKPVFATIEAACYQLQAPDRRSDECLQILTEAMYALAVNVAVRLKQDLLGIEAQQADFDFADGIFLIVPYDKDGKDVFKLEVCFRPSVGVTHLKPTVLMLRQYPLSLPDGLEPLPPLEDA
ncbi:MAG: hypothetical protein CMK86_11310 [Pseudomonadales bacterium]|nr:hypothetical protein [Pseudomonas sp.]MBB49889.1 hypothetical protein [Pseudomonadales bacterium]MBF78472.1 hypothetical protein [Pseudomonadales bacterium]